MPAPLTHIKPDTPMGANLIADGATFRVWAPHARKVYVLGDFNGRIKDDSSLLTKDAQGHWRGFIPGAKDRDRYILHIDGTGSSGLKRDPYARELQSPFPSECVIRETDFPWHETGYVTPRFNDFVIYQLHVGTFYTPNLPRKAGTFLDVARKVPYLAELGVTALQLLPIQEFQTAFSLGYNGTDYFSPEMDFAVEDAALPPYVDEVNELLDARGLARFAVDDLRGEMNQLKALIDVCHIHGLAVILDVVYNHAGGDFGEESLLFFDRQPTSGGVAANSLYFNGREHAGGKVFDFAKPEVRDFLIRNARFFLEEYRVDGFRYDQVSVIDHDGAPHGWRFCQDLTSTLNHVRPEAIDHAEYWNVNPYVVKPPSEGGAGFDTTLTDGLRNAIRDVIRESSRPDERPLAMTGLAASLWPDGFPEPWRFVQGPENHDLVYRGRDQRVARLGDFDDPRSWYGRSRARVATGISLTAPGVPMLFMGQEFLEDKQWADDVENHANLLLYWAGVEAGDKQMLDHIRFTRELLALRRRQPALRGQGFRPVHTHDQNRVLAFHRWVPGEGRDVMVVVHLSTFNRFGYRIGFPPGAWRETFNSDVYENWVNPNVVGNGGGLSIDPIPLHGFDSSASLVLPANSVLVFARD
ncbi:alpha-amylase family glycosyl hydrolase [Planctomyces sp. SH-PL62]|uniref:alpha amylase C-terminal domain-containing protein n=1 Tax=Planctomyces sp. SH-PL62 TaxID=1636152 RepID=UPI00078CCD2B|nr:alpha-amylase family glycosyl hydrolase [Planctomyces sp. SH-PL62]AMV40842.1 1,4-alpha-glucan branching enzyme GlgB [Planctomyces sp. SH-PL62]